mmetsp:Transcript_131181/g.195498  ORF Transcript_131181/g.195498 Transcript_131181/m.195498 type:complete len:220 (+) Transcript_131181:67-726(+)
MKRGSISKLVLAAFVGSVDGWQSYINTQRLLLNSARLTLRSPCSRAVGGLKGHNTFGPMKCKELSMANDDDFWAQQRVLVDQMADRTEISLKDEQKQKFASRRSALIEDTAFFSAIIFSCLWLAFEDPFFSFSYSLGAVLGLAYAYGLGKYVETIGGSVDDTEVVQGAGVGQARFAFLILLFVIVGKYRSYGLLEIPTIAGFFTYQLASLSQGLREIDD